MTEQPESCTRPVRGPILPPADAPTGTHHVSEEKAAMIARVGKKAPDFEAMAFHEGKFKTVRLSDYAGHWVLICFYPGDFTFV